MAVDTGVLPARYANPRLIGRGGMGEIYLAEDTQLGRKVAVKLLGERFASDDPLRARFKREALTAARLSGDPHIITIYDVGEWNGRPFIVMEHMAGGTLGDRARGEPLGHEDALTWLGQAGAALDAAHEQGVVHRDVKPANLLFDSRGEIHVADFGIARVVDDTTGGMTAAGTVMGTAGYLSPEQARGEPATAASDRYALGVVGYELLTGGRPFAGGSETEEAAAHIYQPVPPASQRGVGLPRAVDGVFERALAKEPSARFPTASAFVSALEDALGAKEQTRPLPIPPAAPVYAGGGGRSPDRPADRKSTPLLPVFVGVLLALLIAGAVAAALIGGNGNGAGDPQEEQAPEVTVTQQETLVEEGTTVVETQTIVTTVEAPTTAPSGGGGGGGGGGGVTVQEAVALTDQSTFALRRGDWSAALRYAQNAYGALEGTYRDDFRYEAYVNYDLGKALVELGRCDDALAYLERSEQLQGEREPITNAKRECGAA